MTLQDDGDDDDWVFHAPAVSRSVYNLQNLYTACAQF